MRARRWAGTLAPAGGQAERATSIGVRLRHHVRDPLTSNVYALTFNTIISSVLGIVYWVFAARLYSARDVGVGAMMVSTMTFLSNLSQLNLNSALARFLPAAGAHGRRLVTYSYAISCLVALAASAVFLLGVSVVSERLGFLARTPLLALAFALSVAAWGVFTIQDSVLTALRGAVWVPVENAAFGVSKLVLLVLFASTVPELGIFMSWMVGVILALGPVNALVFRRLLPRLASWRRNAALPGRRALAQFVALDYVGFLFLQAGTNALPLIVTAQLGAEANATFYIGWLLGGSLELVAYHFGTSLTVESAADESHLAAYTRQVLRRGLLLFAPAAALMCLLAPGLLNLFGARYAESSLAVVRLSAVAVLPKLIVVVFVAACRVQRRIGRIIVIQASTTTLVVSLAALTMSTLGVAGVGIAYLAGQTAVATVVLWPLLRLIRGRP